jgi:hypothetical protein
MTLVSIFSLFGIVNTFLGFEAAARKDLDNNPTNKDDNSGIEGQNIKKEVLVPSEVVDW